MSLGTLDRGGVARRAGRWSGAWLALTLALGAPAAAQTAPAPGASAAVAATVEIEVMAIQGFPNPGPADPRIAHLMPALKAFPFQSYQLLDQKEVRLTDGKEEAVKLVDERRMRITLLSHDAREARVRLQLESGEAKVLDTTISIHRNLSFNVAVRGPNGTALFLPVTVRY